jgi:hypothetical protein
MMWTHSVSTPSTVTAGGTLYNTAIAPGNLIVHPQGRTILTIQAENGGDAVIKTNKNTVNLDEIAEMMQVLKDRLLIITPDFEKHEKYPALKEAYDNYKLIEALCRENEDDDKRT